MDKELEMGHKSIQATSGTNNLIKSNRFDTSSCGPDHQEHSLLDMMEEPSSLKYSHRMKESADK